MNIDDDALRALAAEIGAKQPIKYPHKHLRVTALAGTGKTSTMCDLALNTVFGKEIPFEPTKQQAAIVSAISSMLWEVENPRILFCAFAKAIQQELEKRVPSKVLTRTIHSFGFRTLVKNWKFGPDAFNEDRMLDVIRKLTKFSPDRWRRFRRSNGNFISTVRKLVNSCKNNLLPRDQWCDEEFQKLVDHYDITLENSEDWPKVFNCAKQTLEYTLDNFEKELQIDQTDMIWLPVMLNCKFEKFDMVVVDEAQDLNPCQQQVVIRTGERVVFIGDPNQAIFGFAGSDITSMDTLTKTLGDCGELYLTKTHRCGKRIAKFAAELVPAFEAFDSNPEGEVKMGVPFSRKQKNNYRKQVKEGDMILCRCNAPLVSECFWFLKQGRKASIKGRNIGSSLSALVRQISKKNDSLSLNIFVELIDSWYENQLDLERSRTNPRDSYLQLIGDQFQCIKEFVYWCEAGDTVQKPVSYTHLTLPTIYSV